MAPWRARIGRAWRGLHGRGWFEARTLLTLLVILGGIFGFLEIADEVGKGGSRDFDHALMERLRVDGDPRVPIGPAWLPDVARDVTALGSGAVLILLVLLVAVHLALSRRPWLVVLLLAATIGATLLSDGMKSHFDRERPEAAFQLTPVSKMSFPSGHSTLAAATYLTLGLMLSATTARLRMKIFFIGGGALIALLVGLTRVYLGAHFPTDVAAGWCVGAAWAFGCALVAMRIRRRHPAA